MKKTIQILFLICTLNIGVGLFAQSDSVLRKYEAKLKTALRDTTRVQTLRQMSYVYESKADFKKALMYAEKSLVLARKMKDPYHEYRSLLAVGNFHADMGHKADALSYFNDAIRIIDKAKLEDNDKAFMYAKVAYVYSEIEYYSKAMEYYDKSLELLKKAGDHLNALGLSPLKAAIYTKLKKYDECEAFCKKIEAEGIKNFPDKYNTIGVLLVSDTRAKNFFAKNDYTNTILHSRIGLNGAIKIQEPNYTYLFQKQLSLAFHKKNQLDSAIFYGKLALENAKKTDVTEAVSILHLLGEIHFDQKKMKESLAYLEEGMQLAIQGQGLSSQMDFHQLLAKYYSKIKNYKLAEEHLRSYIQLNDSINNAGSRNKIADLVGLAENEARRNEVDLLNKQKELQEQTIARQNLVRNGVIALLVLVLIFAVFVFRSYTRKKRTAIELADKNLLIHHQKELVEEKQKEIIDSINYAQRIQSAILAKEDEIKTHFPESFLLYKPKDIVAGDFYFFESTNTHVFYAAADCTGHGVPGAMVSVVCANALTRCVKEFNLTEPGKILDKARELVLDTFKKSGEDVKDGMDISLLVKEIQNNRYTWSGANNPLWIGRQEQMTEIVADKQPIGLTENPKPFTTHALTLHPGNFIYLFTDGYADQFGGPKGKKFKYKSLQELLVTHRNDQPEALRNKLNTALETWRGELEQVDDICVIGVKV